MTLALLFAGAYLVGSIPFGVLVAKVKGIDLMVAGSGNVGATNVARLLGWRLGILVFLLDIAKGTAPVLVAQSIAGMEDYALLAGLASVIGHMMSPFLKFKGGKGIATSLGVLFGFAPLAGAAGFGVFLVLFAATRIVSFSSLLGSLGVLAAGALRGQSWEFFAVFGPLIAYVFYRHRANIGRLMRGEEAKLEFKKREDRSDDG